LVLVDTSVWIDFLSKRPGSVAGRLDKIIADGTPFAITPIILQEILQGARSAGEFNRLLQNLLTQRFIYPADPVDSYTAAARIYARCRWAGITPRSAIDCLIAQISIENSAQLLHNDADYDRMAQVVPGLAIYRST
jgi:predicted nucleic acid-binding protein